MQSAICRAENTRGSVLGDPLGVRAHDSARTCNLHPRQQSGFGHRVIAVKPLLTVWFSDRSILWNLNVPWEAVAAIALLQWNSLLFFINICSFLHFLFLPFFPLILPQLLNAVFSILLSILVVVGRRRCCSCSLVLAGPRDCRCGVVASIFGSTHAYWQKNKKKIKKCKSKSPLLLLHNLICNKKAQNKTHQKTQGGGGGKGP